MTVVIGSRLSDAPAGRPASAAGVTQDAGKETTRGFGHVLDDAGKRPAKDPARPAGEKPAEKPALLTGSAALAGMPASTPQPDGPHVAKGEHRSGKADNDEAADDDEKSKHAEAAGQADAPAPLRDRTPLLAALNALGQRNREPTGNTGTKPQSSAMDAAPTRTLEGPAQAVAILTGARSQPTAAAGPVASDKTPDAGSPVPAFMPGKAAGDGIAAGDGQDVLSAATPPDSTADDEPEKTVRPGRADAKEVAREAETIGRDSTDRRAANTVTVTHERSFPAPPAHAMSPAAARVVEALAAGARPPSQAPVPASLPSAAVAVPAHMLKIELHPAELGVVTASLRLSGGQLSVELKPETAEAYHRLSADTDTIAQSLKKLGFDVDAVSVMQPAVAVQAAVRADGGGPATAAMPGRDTSQFQSGTSGGSAGNPGGQQSGRNDGHEKAFERPAPAHRERAGGSLFI